MFEWVQSDLSRDLTRRGEAPDRPQGVNQGQAGQSSDPRMCHQPSDVRVLFRQRLQLPLDPLNELIAAWIAQIDLAEMLLRPRERGFLMYRCKVQEVRTSFCWASNFQRKFRAKFWVKTRSWAGVECAGVAPLCR